MKKTLIPLLLVLTLMTVLCLPAAAGTDANAFTALTVADGFTEKVSLTPLTADGTPAAAINGVYMDAVKMNVEYDGTAAGSFYLVLALTTDNGVPTENNIQYIDQSTAAGGAVSFTVYPRDLEPGMTYYIYLSSNADGQVGALTKVASFAAETVTLQRVGDVDGNGAISSNDALWVLNAAAQNITLNAAQQLAADVNHDGVVDVTDALLILRAVVHLETIA